VSHRRQCRASASPSATAVRWNPACTITAGTKVTVLDADGQPRRDGKAARDLAGQVRSAVPPQQSTNGAVECLTNRSAVELNHRTARSHN
jgi:2,3,4,5-tetrahydropyridine-2-carboxylate N-succinyltransferase